MPLLSSRHMSVAIGDDGISISYQPPLSLTLGSKARARDVRYRVKTKLKRAAPLSRNDDGNTVRARFELSSARQLKVIIAEIDRLLDDFPKERLTPQRPPQKSQRLPQMRHGRLTVNPRARRKFPSLGFLRQSGTRWRPPPLAGASAQEKGRVWTFHTHQFSSLPFCCLIELTLVD